MPPSLKDFESALRESFFKDAESKFVNYQNEHPDEDCSSMLESSVDSKILQEKLSNLLHINI